MLKPVKSVIAAARILLRRPSEQKLATEDLRFLLHQSLEELNQLILKENQDYCTHETEIGLTYSDTVRGYTLNLVTSARPGIQNSGVEPVFFLYQPTSSDEQTDPWQKVSIVKLATLAAEGWTINAPSVAYIGNDWQGISEAHFKFNLDDDFIADQRWRLAFRYFPQEILDLDDTVPFPPQHSSLLEHTLAQKALSLVRDDSPSWRAFAASRSGELLVAVERQKMGLIQWLAKSIENDYVTSAPYHYRLNNPLHGRSRRIKAQW
jgi:hypothetical protein